MSTINVKCISTRVYYDDQGRDARGWVAEYTRSNGTVIEDSQKAWHPEMPKRRDARTKAMRIARSHARKLAKQVCGR